MPHAERTITINRPPDDVFRFFTTPSNDQSWRKGVKEILPEGPIAVGTKVHQVVAGPAGRPIAADIEITAYDPPSRYGFIAISGPARPVGEYRFAPSGTGTEVMFSLNAELGGIKGLLLSRPVQSTMDAEMRALDTAKATLEAG
jgi:ligand-binding SRPBCC domain-containing protein